jgi:hypothetical protein
MGKMETTGRSTTVTKTKTEIEYAPAFTQSFLRIPSTRTPMAMASPPFIARAPAHANNANPEWPITAQ